MRASRKISLGIPTPCSEPWDGMSENEEGKFCVNCQKNVKDFTGFSDDELLAYFNENRGNQCGRMKPSQLYRVFSGTASQSNRLGVPGLLKLVVGSLLTLFSAKSSLAQIKEEHQNRPRFEQIPSTVIKQLPKLPSGYVEISGKVLAKYTRLPLVGALVQTEDGKYQTSAGLNGEFHLSFPQYHFDEYAYLEIANHEYDNQCIAVNLRSVSDEIIVEMRYNNYPVVVTGGICVYPADDKKWETEKAKLFLKSISPW